MIDEVIQAEVDEMEQNKDVDFKPQDCQDNEIETDKKSSYTSENDEEILDNLGKKIKRKKPKKLKKRVIENKKKLTGMEKLKQMCDDIYVEGQQSKQKNEFTNQEKA